MAILFGKSHVGTRLKLASYVYDQTDAPRTDLCPPPGQPEECLTYEEQFRSIVYANYTYASSGPSKDLRATLSWQRQHERRRFDHSRTTGRSTTQSTTSAEMTWTAWGPSCISQHASSSYPNWSLKLSAGVDHYFDLVSSYAWRVYNDVDITRQQSRGQYVDGAWHHMGGIYFEKSTRYKIHLRSRRHSLRLAMDSFASRSRVRHQPSRWSLASLGRSRRNRVAHHAQHSSACNI